MQLNLDNSIHFILLKTKTQISLSVSDHSFINPYAKATPVLSSIFKPALSTMRAFIFYDQQPNQIHNRKTSSLHLVDRLIMRPKLAIDTETARLPGSVECYSPDLELFFSPPELPDRAELAEFPPLPES